MTLTGLLISSVSTGGSGGELVPVEHITLNYSKIEFEYQVQDDKGVVGNPVRAMFDLKAQKA